MSSAYLRFPHVRGESITFVAGDDLWLATTSGGRAWRLTSERQPVRTPRLSPDGSQVAFVSTKDGRPEVYVVDVADDADRAPRRLTWWGASVSLVLDWTTDGRILVASNHAQQSMRHVVVHSLSVDGSVEVLDAGPAWGLATRGDGARALVTPGSRPTAQWKRYRGGTASRLWFDPQGDGTWTRLLPQDTAAIVDPLWIGNALVFSSDRAATFPDHADEQANLWVWRTPGEGEPEQLTHQGEDLGYVRDATSDGERIIWHTRGQLWILDSLDATPRRIELHLPGLGAPSAEPEPTDRLTDIVADHCGDASLIGWQGGAYWLPHRAGPARALVADSGVRVREPQLLGRTERAVVVTDADGEDALDIHDLTGAEAPRQIATAALGRVLHVASDPAGQRLLTISHDGAIRLVDVASGEVDQLGHSGEGEAEHPSFSPDGRYALWSQPTYGEAALHQLIVVDLTASAADRTPVAITSGKVNDHSPAFTADGQHVVFLSDRTFDPTYDQHEFGLSFTGSTRPWLIPLSATQPAPFGPSVDGWRFSETADASHGTKNDQQDDRDSADQPPTSPDLDADGAEDRIVPFPVVSGSYRDLRAAADGVLWVREAQESGELGSRRAGVEGDPAADAVEFFCFATRSVSTVAEQAESYALSGDGRRIVVRHEDTVWVQSANRAPAKDNPQDKVAVDLGRLHRRIDLPARWRQMFEENARIMRDHFWRDDMDGVDWDAVLERWRPVLDRVRTHDDLVDLLWETVGELNTSHAYVTPVPDKTTQSRRIGLLGADLSAADGGWRIDRILPGESTEPDARSPLRAAGVDAQVGDLIVAVGGVPVDPQFGPNAALTGTANQPVELTLRRDGTDRRVVVIPIADEEVLRYQDWVASRRAYVHDRSGGRLGYLHVPDMGTAGWAQLHRDLRFATRTEGLIADVRYNRGGHTSQMVLARLLRRIVGWAPARHYATVGSYPNQAPRGPVVLVANEYSGSDGDIVNAAAQAYGLGPVVGVRTWGGVVGIDGRFDLVDGTSITQPRYAFWLEGKGFGVENYGVDPDIEVQHSPADFFSPDDPQLDRAIAEALTSLEQNPAATPPEWPEPKVR